MSRDDEFCPTDCEHIIIGVPIGHPCGYTRCCKFHCKLFYDYNINLNLRPVRCEECIEERAKSEEKEEAMSKEITVNIPIKSMEEIDNLPEVSDE